MKITALETQKKNKKRYNLYIDDEFFEGVEENTVAILNLYVGKDLDEGDPERIRGVELEEKLHGMCLGLVSRYRKTSEEIRRYILAKGYSEDMALKELKRLEKYGFADDEAYVRDYLELNRSDSLRMARHRLGARGIDGEFFDRVAAGADMAAREADVIKKVAGKKFRSLREKDNIRDRIYRYLMGKGFDSDMIIRTIKEIELTDKEKADESFGD